MSECIKLRSERLILEELKESDAEFVVRIRSNPDVYRYFKEPREITPEDHLEWYRNSYIYNDNRIDFVAFDLEGIPVGVFGIRRSCKNSDVTEVSYILAQEYYGKGYASEALERLIIYSKEFWKSNTVIAEIHICNSSSIKFIENKGFIKKSEDGMFAIYERTI